MHGFYLYQPPDYKPIQMVQKDTMINDFKSHWEIKEDHTLSPSWSQWTLSLSKISPISVLYPVLKPDWSRSRLSTSSRIIWGCILNNIPKKTMLETGQKLFSTSPGLPLWGGIKPHFLQSQISIYHSLDISVWDLLGGLENPQGGQHLSNTQVAGLRIPMTLSIFSGITRSYSVQISDKIGP